MDLLPSEIVLQIALHLHPSEIVNLQLVSKRYLEIARDDRFWRDSCFSSSSFKETLRKRQELLAISDVQEPRLRDLARALAKGNGLGDSRLVKPREEVSDQKARANERIRIMANWDPSYPAEKICWYDEYIARNAPISTSWFQQPRHRENAGHEYLEVRGMALYTPKGEPDAALVVAPLDDGSVCLWDMNGSRGRKGSIVARSRSGILFTDGDVGDATRRSKMVNTGVTECISVDSESKKAFIAVQNGLVEVDLETLSTVNQEKYAFSITALSSAQPGVPITVGTNLALYLHDFRQKRSQHNVQSVTGIDQFDTAFDFTRNSSGRSNFHDILKFPPASDYAPLHQSGPLSILHLPNANGEWDDNGDIYVAGRFSSILKYDRRYFPKLRGTIYSGARLCCLTSLPYSFSSMTKDLARRGELSLEQVSEAKKLPGNTLIAGGEYNSKGSLEMYGLSPLPQHATISSDSMAGRLQNSTMKNRQTSSSSKILSVCNHGTRICLSDGSGNLKWLERDGFTEVRRWNIAHESVVAPRGLWGSLGDSYMDSGAEGIARKILNTHRNTGDRPINEDNLLLWTGEKLGLLRFSSKASFNAEDFEETAKSTEQAHKEREERIYGETMRRALEHSADEARYVRGLGLELGNGLP